MKSSIKSQKSLGGCLFANAVALASLLLSSAMGPQAVAQTGPCCPEVAGTKWLQPPDTTSPFNPINIMTAPPYVVADDFGCTNTGPITDIRIWGSFFNDVLQDVTTFTLTIWSDVPVGQAGTFSQPGVPLWVQTFQPGTYNRCVYTNTFGVLFLPQWSQYSAVFATNLYYLCFTPPSTNPFVQHGTPTSPTNYWLSVSTQPYGTGGQTLFGWKISVTNYNDTAVYGIGGPPWTPIYNTNNNFSPVNMAFEITTATNTTTPVLCGDTNTVKFYLPPQTTPNLGYNVEDSRNKVVLAHDFLCTSPGPITGIHVWGSWLNDLHGSVSNFWIGIYSDVPSITNFASGQVTWSHPGTLLWSNNFAAAAGQFTEIYYTNSYEGFYYPSNNVQLGFDTQVYQYCFFPTNPFYQLGTAAAPTNYWLAIRAQFGDNNSQTNYGWKSAAIPYGDPAVWGTFAGLPVGNWQSITNPQTQQPMHLSMLLTTSNPPPTQTDCCMDTNGVKYVQWPDAFSGYDVWNCNTFPPGVTDGPWLLADDFVCTNTGKITDIHLWGSWWNNLVASNSLTFWLGIFTDVPTNAANPYSHPGTLIWEQCFTPYQYSECFWGYGQENFMDAGPTNVFQPTLLGAEQQIWYYCFYPSNPPTQYGTAALPTNYWLAADAFLPTVTQQNYFGWKTTTNLQHDISVRAYWNLPFCPTNLVGQSYGGWTPNYAPGTPTPKPLDLAFKITTATNNQCPLPVLQCSNQVFQCGTAWTIQPPPVIDVCCPSPNLVTLAAAPITNSTACSQVITYVWKYTDCLGRTVSCSETVTVLDSNPPVFTGCVTNQTVPCGSNWVFNIPTASYLCSGSNVVVGVVGVTSSNPNACTQIFTETWAATNACSGAVAYCTETVTVQDTNAPVFAGCINAKTVVCGSVVTFDTPTASYVCSGSNAPVGISAATNYTVNPCTSVKSLTWSATNACSGAIGTCTEVITIVATNPPIITCYPNKGVTNDSAWVFDTPTAVDACSGTNVPVTTLNTVTNGNVPCNQTYTRTWKAVDICGNYAYCSQTVTNLCPPVVCVESDYEKYVQWPKTIGGYDVWNQPYVLADDFVCTNTGPISDIHLWGSWNANAALTNSITFWLGIYNDVPTNANNRFSHPGTNLLWQQWFAPGQYAETIWTANAQEYFMDPGTTNCIGSDSVVWYYCFYPTNAFQQLGTPTNHTTYWLAAYALQTNGNYLYGWKTATNVSHDISVHALWPGVPPINNPGWSPNYAYTNCTPTNTIGLDLAFKLTMCSPLTIRYVAPTNVVVSWQGGGYLQSSTNVVGPYRDVPGFPPSPFTDWTVSPTNKFYRLRCY